MKPAFYKNSLLIPVFSSHVHLRWAECLPKASPHPTELAQAPVTLLGQWHRTPQLLHFPVLHHRSHPQVAISDQFLRASSRIVAWRCRIVFSALLFSNPLSTAHLVLSYSGHSEQGTVQCWIHFWFVKICIFPISLSLITGFAEHVPWSNTVFGGWKK